MVDKSLLVVSIGTESSTSVHLEAEVCEKGKAKIAIISSGRNPKKLFEWVVSEKEVESLQNLFIFLKNEMGMSRLECSLRSPKTAGSPALDGNEQSQIQ
tara:strand:+ start:264 stop:560 length:297 start_codon:yes stop_codon:yes gene_type:complete